MALGLEHINGVPADNRIENLQIVCPNCTATLDTLVDGRTGMTLRRAIVFGAELRSLRKSPANGTARNLAAPAAPAPGNRGQIGGRSSGPPRTN